VLTQRSPSSDGLRSHGVRRTSQPLGLGAATAEVTDPERDVENAQYNSATQPQTEIKDCFPKITKTSIMTRTTDTGSAQGADRIVLGATVVLREETAGEAVTYQIVGAEEADVKAGRLSVASPLARALIGKEVGDTATVEAPAGIRRYEVLDVRFE
jgi:transcription elongation factor GreA